MLRKTIFLLILTISSLLCFPVFTVEKIPAVSKKILIATVPKSGTHLLRKAIFLLTEKKTQWIGLQTKYFDVERDLRMEHPITGIHLFPLFDSIREQYLDRYISILLIRDPRDVMLSFSNHLRRGLYWTACPQFDLDRYEHLPFDLQLQEAFTFPKEYLNPAICFPYVALWMKEPSVFVCRFEDLVGSQGGGSDERQRHLLFDLAQHLGCSKSWEEIDLIAKQLFGGTWTFYTGKIGLWEKFYSFENQNLFMSLYGEYISEWGYE